MADLLLDTHVFLWWQLADRRLSEAAKDAIAAPTGQVLVSAASIWEIAIKQRAGKLAFGASPTRAIELNGFVELPISAIVAEAAGSLDWRHADPFDRLLVAQAEHHALVLVTADREISRYASVAQLWAGA